MRDNEQYSPKEQREAKRSGNYVEIVAASATPELLVSKSNFLNVSDYLDIFLTYCSSCNVVSIFVMLVT